VKQIILTVLFLIPALTYATNSGDYQTSGNVTFSTSTNWQTYNGSTWVTASTAPVTNTSAQITINANHTATLNSTITLKNLTVKQGGNFTISSSRTLTLSTGALLVEAGGTLTNNGTITLNSSITQTIYGTLINSGTLTANGNLLMYGTYRHNISGTSFPAISNITWYDGSTCEITGTTSSLPNISGHAFHNFTWNCASQSSSISLNNYITSVSGDLNILNTNSRILTFFSSNNTLVVTGNMNISGTSSVRLSSSSNTTSITINGNYVQSAGTFNLGDGTNTMNLKGNFTISGGTISRSSGTAKINFNGTTTQYFSSSNASSFSSNVNIDVAQNSTLQLMSTMNPSGTNGTNLFNVYGTLDMANNNISLNFYMNIASTGTLKTGTGVITSSSSATNNFQVSSGSVLYVGSADGINTSGFLGNIRVDGTRTFNAGAKYVYNGTTAQVTGNGLPSSIADLVTNNSEGLTLSNNVTVTDTLFMTNGDITTGSYTLTLSNSNTNSLSYSAGLINGKFARAIASGNASYTFPLGNGGMNRKAIVSFTTQPSSAATLTAQFIPGNPGGNQVSLTDAGNYTVDTYSQDGEWQFSYTGPSNPVYSINLTADGIAGVNTPSALRIINRTSAASSWALSGTHSNGSSGPFKANRNGLTFSALMQFAIGGNSVENPLDGTLPVELVSFVSSLSNGKDVKLNWVTSSEMNNAGFEIQRKDNNSEFKKIGFVKGNNNTNSNSYYSFEDKNLNTGKYSYRLKQIDNNGNFEYFTLSNTVEVGTPNKYNLSQNYPNPFNPVTKISYSIAIAGQVTLKVYDMTGKEIKTLVNEVKSAGFYTVDFSGANLASGIYLYKISAGNYSETKKMSLIK
jgi:hypothetical protein